MKSIEKFNNKFFFGRYLLFVLVITIIFPYDIFRTPALGLDASWQIGLELAIKNNFKFGKDIVFTWGPLSFLTLCLNIYKSKFLVIVFHLFHSANVIFLIFHIVKKINRNEVLITIFTMLIIYGDFLFEKVPICFLFISIFYFFYFIKTKKSISVWVISAYASLTFFIKVDFSFVLLFYSTLFLLYNIFFKKIKLLNHLFAYISGLLSIFLLGSLLDVDMLKYVKNSFHIINYYNDAMSIIPNFYFQVFFSFFSFFSLLLFLSFLILKYKKIKADWFLFFSITSFIFLAMKYGYVRLDHQHYKSYLILLVFSVLLYIVFTSLPKKTLELFFIALSIFSVAMQIDNIFLEKEKSIRDKEYSQNPNKLYSQYLPQKIIKKIGNKSIDFLGSNISYIFYNNLNYNPRPVFQSYAAYSDGLIEINATKYSSNNAPDFILHEYEAWPNKIPNSFEAKTQLEALRNYNLEDSVIFEDKKNSLLLLRKEKLSKTLQTKILLDTLVYLNDKINIPKSENLIYLQMEYEYTFFGKIRRFLFQPSLAQIKIDKNTFYLIKPIVKSGVLINYLFSSFNDLKNFYECKWIKNPKVNSIEILANPLWINKKIKIKLVEKKII
tara:strand:- start:2746 stop:4572 length:1827 start_codon:yes stop_codon:yes gene_type:complete